MAEPTLSRYLETLFGRDREGFVEIAHRVPGDRMRRSGKGGVFLPAAELDRVVAAVHELAGRADVWVGVLPRRPHPQTGEIGGSKDFVADARVLWVDVDLKETPDAEARLRRFRPAPQMVVRSGGGFHAYWLLSEPLGREWVPIANRRLAHALGADIGSTDAARILRPPGTRNWKYDPPREVELAGLGQQLPYRARDVVGGLPDPPGRPTRPREHFRPAPHLAADPLRAIPPPVYVRQLAGTDVPDAGGVVRCPLPDHDDPEPSCQVFAEPERGWYCYGCQRGGSIFDFAAALLGLQTSGRDFVALRRELERRFGLERTGAGPAGRSRRGEPRAVPARPSDRGGPGATALAEHPQAEVAGPSLASSSLPRAGAVEEDGDEGEDAWISSPGSPRESTRRSGPGWKAGLVLGVVALSGVGLFLVVFAVLPLSKPQSGELVCGVSGAARKAIPAAYLALYRGVGRHYGLDWAFLAAIGQVESGHGRNMGPSSAGALGPMQFMPGTWAAYGVDGDGDGRRDVMDPEDAIRGAARYLRASGAPGDWRRALFAYNHAGWYVQQVIDQAERYRATCRELAEPFRPGDGTLGWPIRGPVTGRFGDPRPGHRHAGIDIPAPIGTPIHAAERGRVVLRGVFQGYGNYLCVQHLPRLTTCQGHLAEFRARLGEVVRRGEVIALVGCTGRCHGPHIHFEVRRGPPWSQPVDPLRYLRKGR